MGDMMQMFMRMIMPLVKEIAESSRAYVTAESDDDCSALPANDQMMSFPVAMKMACMRVSEFIRIISKFSLCSCLSSSKTFRLLLATVFACVGHWACLAWAASAQCAEPVTCSSSPLARSACYWTWRASWWSSWKAWCRLGLTFFLCV